MAKAKRPMATGWAVSGMIRQGDVFRWGRWGERFNGEQFEVFTTKAEAEAQMALWRKNWGGDPRVVRVHIVSAERKSKNGKG